MAHTITNKTRLVARVRRIAGQIAAVEKAIDAEIGCAAVLQQVASVRGAVGGLMDELIEVHLREHVAAPELNEETRAAGADELIAVIRRYTK